MSEKEVKAAGAGTDADKGKGDLTAEALKAYGIDRKYVLKSRMDPRTGEAVVVTVGGAKVRYKAGASVQPLSEIRVTGVNPEWKKRKPIAGAGAK